MGLVIHAEKILDELLIVAKAKRASIPYSEDEGMPQKVVFVGPGGEVESLNLTWQDEREKYRKMRAVSETAKDLFCSAVVMISDTRWVKSDDFVEYFHLKPVSEMGIKEWQKEYLTILNGIYGGLIKNLPRQLWKEAIITVIKGPRIKCESRMAPYIEGPNDSIQYIEADVQNHDTMQFNLLPDWWV